MSALDEARPSVKWRGVLAFTHFLSLTHKIRLSASTTTEKIYKTLPRSNPALPSSTSNSAYSSFLLKYCISSILSPEYRIPILVRPCASLLLLHLLQPTTATLPAVTMARLSDLPTEIIQIIVELASPEDIDSQTTICKTVYYAAAKIVERHRALKKKHGVRHFSHPGPPDIHRIRQEVTQFLYQIFEDPNLAFYVRELSLDGLMGWSRDTRYNEQLSSRIREAVAILEPKE